MENECNCLEKKHEKTEYICMYGIYNGPSEVPYGQAYGERKNPDPEPTDQLTSGLSSPAPYAIPKAGNGPHFKRRRKAKAKRRH